MWREDPLIQLKSGDPLLFLRALSKSERVCVSVNGIVGVSVSVSVSVQFSSVQFSSFQLHSTKASLHLSAAHCRTV